MDQVDLEALTADLRDPDHRIRSEASKKLLENGGESAMKIFLDACTDDREATREIAASALSEIGDGRAIEPLLEGLSMGSDWPLWNSAHLAFVHIGEPAVDTLINSLSDPRFPDWDTRSFVFIQALGKIGDERAVQPLIDLLVDPRESSVHHAVARALADIGDPRAVGAIIWAMEQYPTSRAHDSYVDALVRLKDPRAFDTFVVLLSHDQEAFRKWGAKGLGSLGDSRAISHLEPLCSDRSAAVREWAVRALGDIADEKAIGVLKLTMEDDNKEVRKRAVKALKRIGTEEALRALHDDVQ